MINSQEIFFFEEPVYNWLLTFVMTIFCYSKVAVFIEMVAHKLIRRTYSRKRLVSIKYFIPASLKEGVFQLGHSTFETKIMWIQDNIVLEKGLF